jgi:hypothetical protein
MWRRIDRSLQVRLFYSTSRRCPKTQILSKEQGTVSKSSPPSDKRRSRYPAGHSLRKDRRVARPASTRDAALTALPCTIAA